MKILFTNTIYIIIIRNTDGKYFFKIHIDITFFNEISFWKYGVVELLYFF